MSALFSLDLQAVRIIRATTKQQILSDLSRCFAEVYALDPETVIDGIEEREKLGSTGFGRGVAIPHARIDGLERPVAAFLRLEEPVEFAAADGMPVLGNGGPIAIPPEEKLDIGQDGTISIRALGEDPNVVVTVDRLKLVNPDPQQLEKGTDGLIRMKDGQPLEADANVRVTSGFLEASNVNAVAEMTSMLALSRQFELHVKMMRTAEDDAAAMARVLQIS